MIFKHIEMMIPNVLEFECGARRSKHEIVVDTWDSSYFMSESLAPVFCGMVPTRSTENHCAWPKMCEFVRPGLQAVCSLPALAYESATVTKHKAALKKSDWRQDILAALQERVEPRDDQAQAVNTKLTRFHSSFKQEFDTSILDGTAALTICNFHLQALNIKSFGEHGDGLQEINPQA